MKKPYRIKKNEKHQLTGILMILSLFYYSFTLSQYYSSGQDPASTKWMQINTKNFQVIFPENFKKQANELANNMETVYDYVSFSLKNKPKKVSVILHNQSVTSNATVVWAPKRMDFYTCPPQNIYPQKWLEQLALHEYRHVVQVDKINQGFSKILYYIFGEQITGGILGLYIPFWFLEGDAVATETALSNAGRGRVPSFNMKLRTQILEKGIYSYDKAVFGSYKDYVPNHYILGYHIVAMARKNYGTNIWSAAIDKTARYPFMITPFNKGIKTVSGLSKTKLYKDIMNELDSSWRKQKKSTPLSDYVLFSKNENKFYTDYRNPLYLNDSSIITQRSGLDDINRFVLVRKNYSDEILFTPGILFDVNISFSNGKICWSEKGYDERWHNRSYAEIKIYDIEEKQLIKLTSKSRYFAPCLSKKGDKIVSVHVSPENHYSLVILNSKTGELLREYRSPTNDFFITPVWDNNDSKIITIILNEKGKSLVMIDPDNNDMTSLVPHSATEISKPRVKGKYVFFTASYSGIDNIYAVDTSDLKIYQVTSSKFGATDIQFSPDGKKIVYSDYSVNGYRLVEAIFNPVNFKPLNTVTDNSVKLFASISEQEIGIVDFESIIETNYEVKRYRKFPHLFNIHSWAPLSIDVDNIEINPGLSLMSQNKLSSTFLNMGYKYNVNEETGKYFLNLDYEGLYPIFNIKLAKGKRSHYYKDENNQSRSFTWDETNIETGIRVPLNLTRGKYYRLLQPQLSSTYTYYNYGSQVHGIPDANFRTLEYRISGYNQIKTSQKDIYPQWGQILDLNFRHTPFGGSDIGDILAAESRLFFPGLFKHQSINIYAAFQRRNNTGTYQFGDLVNYPKGYTGQSNDSLCSFSVNYDLPLFYLDLRLGSLIYLKRIRANIFYDYGEGWNRGQRNIYRSHGTAVLCNLHLLRFVAPIEIGARFIYVPEYSDFKTELLFGINFSDL